MEKSSYSIHWLNFACFVFLVGTLCLPRLSWSQNQQKENCDVDEINYLQCVIQNNFSSFKIEGDIAILSTHQIPHIISIEDSNYFIETTKHEVYLNSKKQLLMQSIWIKNDQRSSSRTCLRETDTFFYFLSEEDVLDLGIFYLWDEHKKIFISKSLYELRDEELSEEKIKVFYVRHCITKP